MTERQPVPPRVRVTSPRAGRPRRRSVASEIDAESEVGEIYMRSLMRTQLRLALTVVGILALTICSLPLVFWLSPAVRHAHLLGVPVAHRMRANTPCRRSRPVHMLRDVAFTNHQPPTTRENGMTAHQGERYDRPPGRTV